MVLEKVDFLVGFDVSPEYPEIIFRFIARTLEVLSKRTWKISPKPSRTVILRPRLMCFELLDCEVPF